MKETPTSGHQWTELHGLRMRVNVADALRKIKRARSRRSLERVVRWFPKVDDFSVGELDFINSYIKQRMAEL